VRLLAFDLAQARSAARIIGALTVDA